MTQTIEIETVELADLDKVSTMAECISILADDLELQVSVRVKASGVVMCQRCHIRPAIWAVQNIEGYWVSCRLGSHYRGFRLVKMCDQCKDAAKRDDPALVGL